MPSRKALLVSDATLSPECAVEPNVDLQRQLLQGHTYGFGEHDVKVLSRAGLTTAEVMTEIRRWLVAGAVAGDMRLLMVTAHGGVRQLPDGEEVQSFGLMGDPDTINDHMLAAAFAPLIAAGVIPWTCFEACSGVTKISAETKLRFQFNRDRMIEQFRRRGVEFWRKEERMRTSSGLYSPAGNTAGVLPNQQFPNPALNSVSLRGCKVTESCSYYEGWGGLFTQALTAVAAETPRSPADDIIELVLLGMRANTYSQIPILTGIPGAFRRPLFT